MGTDRIHNPLAAVALAGATLAGALIQLGIDHYVVAGMFIGTCFVYAAATLDDLLDLWRRIR